MKRKVNIILFALTAQLSLIGPSEAVKYPLESVERAYLTARLKSTTFDRNRSINVKDKGHQLAFEIFINATSQRDQGSIRFSAENFWRMSKKDALTVYKTLRELHPLPEVHAKKE